MLEMGEKTARVCKAGQLIVEKLKEGNKLEMSFDTHLIGKVGWQKIQTAMHTLT